MNHHINCRGHTIWISKRSTGILTWNQTSQLNIRTSYRKENIMSERFFSQNLNQLKGFWENRVTVVADKLDIFPQKETDWCRQPAGCTAYPDNHYLPNETPLSGKKKVTTTRPHNQVLLSNQIEATLKYILKVSNPLPRHTKKSYLSPGWFKSPPLWVS